MASYSPPIRTPPEEREQRDPRRLYAKGRTGQVQEFTGVSNPYEVPASTDITTDATHFTPAKAAGGLLPQIEHARYTVQV